MSDDFWVPTRRVPQKTLYLRLCWLGWPLLEKEANV